jgi:hypothetical protein
MWPRITDVVSIVNQGLLAGFEECYGGPSTQNKMLINTKDPGSL